VYHGQNIWDLALENVRALVFNLKPRPGYEIEPVWPMKNEAVPFLCWVINIEASEVGVR
jgi:hypothetical protein